ncbi:MFS sugar transporter-like protein [Dactylonectria estremocensis]|uniref:MFS sugar transporter-like protein n=1 Tax=Dactylonectria estremocensis TaxID=1079267 RepID=A0A9P9E6F3_9HYPO|nr:MFS sugar transporter-like protein [Dactylonectria estremocensis]
MATTATPLLGDSNQHAPTSLYSFDRPSDRDTTRGRLRAYWLGSVVCMGAFLFGYDSGIVGGVLTMASFQRDFGYGKHHQTRTSALSVGLQQLGAFVGCFLAWPIAERFGRKKPLVLSSAIFCAGGVFQTINTGSLATFYAARVVSGLGLGASTVVVPMFSGEMVPTELRGQVGSFFQLFFTLGIFASYWIDYGASCIENDPTSQWQIPIGLQLLPAMLLGGGVLTLKESARWLTRKGRHDDAWQSLAWIRGDESQTTMDEIHEIRLGVEAEAEETEGFEFRELLQGDSFKRVFAAFCIMAAQQATGATAFAYFGPQYFTLLVGDGHKALLLTGIFGAVKVAACGAFVLFLANRFSRRHVLVGGAAAMAVCQIATAIVVKLRPAPDDGKVTSSGIVTVGLIYLFVATYNISWGPLPWPYMAEIFPARIREPGIAIGAASQWLFNLLFSLTTPYMMERLGWGTFLVWGCFDVAISVLACLFLTETKDLSLEAIANQRFNKRV